MDATEMIGRPGGPFAVLRFQGVKSNSDISAMLGHWDRARVTPSADPHGLVTWVHGATNGPELYGRVIAELPEKFRKNGVRLVEGIVSASPEYFRPGDAPAYGSSQQDRLDAFVEATMSYLRARWGSRLMGAVLHLDEATPHLHAAILPTVELSEDDLAAPRGRGKGPGKSRFNAAGLFNPKSLAEMQTEIGNALRHLGIRRGISRVTIAQHRDIKEFYGLVHRELPTAREELATASSIQKRTEAEIDEMELRLNGMSAELEGARTDLAEVRRAILAEEAQAKANARIAERNAAWVRMQQAARDDRKRAGAMTRFSARVAARAEAAREASSAAKAEAEATWNEAREAALTVAMLEQRRRELVQELGETRDNVSKLEARLHDKRLELDQAEQDHRWFERRIETLKREALQRDEALELLSQKLELTRAEEAAAAHRQQEEGMLARAARAKAEEELTRELEQRRVQGDAAAIASAQLAIASAQARADKELAGTIQAIDQHRRDLELAKGDLAKVRGLDLSAVLMSLGCKPEPQDPRAWTTPAGRLLVGGKDGKDPSRFRLEATSKTGRNAIDAVMHIDGVDFETATRWLAQQFEIEAVAVTAGERSASRARRTLASFPAIPIAPFGANGIDDKTLVQNLAERYGKSPVTDALIKAGKIKGIRWGDRLHAAFPLSGFIKDVRGGGVRIEAIDGSRFSTTRGQGDFYDLRPGTHRLSKFLVVTQSPLDALAYAAMAVGNARDNIAALPEARVVALLSSANRLVSHVVKEAKEAGQHLLLALRDDEAGRRLRAAVLAEAKRHAVEVRHSPLLADIGCETLFAAWHRLHIARDETLRRLRDRARARVRQPGENGIGQS